MRHQLDHSRQQTMMGDRLRDRQRGQRTAADLAGLERDTVTIQERQALRLQRGWPELLEDSRRLARIGERHRELTALLGQLEHSIGEQDQAIEASDDHVEPIADRFDRTFAAMA